MSEKSIVFFEQTEHVLNSVIAYNNLGIHLLHIGSWEKAEEMILRALDLAKRSEHVHVAGILDSLGELNILRGDTDEARALLEQAVEVAREKKREWYEAQAMRNLSRCLLAEGKYEEAADMARKTIELCRQIGESIMRIWRTRSGKVVLNRNRRRRDALEIVEGKRS